MGIFKKKKRVETDDYFDLELDNPDIGPDYSSEYDGLDMDDPYGDDQPVGKKKKKNNIAGNIASVLGVIVAVAAVVVIGYLIFSVITGPSKKECYTVISNFEHSSNELDLSGMADGIEPSVRTKVKAAILVIEALTKTDTEDILKMVVNALGSGFIPEGSSAQLTDVFKTITIEPVKYGFPGKKRIVKCRCSIMGIDQYMNFTIVKSNGECYIASVEIAKE